MKKIIYSVMYKYLKLNIVFNNLFIIIQLSSLMNAFFVFFVSMRHYLQNYFKTSISILIKTLYLIYI